jgi:hypothetical protein
MRTALGLALIASLAACGGTTRLHQHGDGSFRL